MTNIMDFTQNMVEVVSIICIIAISISLVLLLYRVIKGPSNPDRAVALDAIGVNIMALAGLLAVLLVTTYFNDVILLIGILLFIGTIAIAKFLEMGVIIDHDMD
ncbi:Na(+)/H(+) antiporter subunit F1 [Terrihalobacillus insolitus]|uniref:Na(+)/H(+) antiporter subunit F1 n=1 Tax=Terrihalobacillus insolitus TaxID=2950438 RepID=UPI0023406A44|nr:Na(+)/H(+) antiporter subunit F1 [Terrihalobacillus insolitus]MDC3413308.1 Na(+)/H(+) antiporter subunit F1 [Terrihalobacillus insolitus]